MTMMRKMRLPSLRIGNKLINLAKIKRKKKRLHKMTRKNKTKEAIMKAIRMSQRKKKTTMITLRYNKTLKMLDKKYKKLLRNIITKKYIKIT